MKYHLKAAKEAVERATSLGQQVSSEAGLTVLHGEKPTDFQARLAALHAREDAATVLALLMDSYAQQAKVLRWTRITAAVALLALMTTCSQIK